MTHNTPLQTEFVRNAGLLTMLGAILGIVINIGELTILSDTTTAAFLVAQMVGALGFGLILVGLIGLDRSGAVGTGTAGVLGIKAAVIGQTIAIPSQFIQHIDYDMATALGILAGIVLGIGMVLAGVSVIQTQVWRGWRQYTPLLYGLFPLLLVPTYPLLIQLPVFASGSDQLFTIITLAFWLWFGIALVGEADSSAITSQRALND